jgi:hypothetical protein
VTSNLRGFFLLFGNKLSVGKAEVEEPISLFLLEV